MCPKDCNNLVIRLHITIAQSRLQQSPFKIDPQVIQFRARYRNDDLQSSKESVTVPSDLRPELLRSHPGEPSSRRFPNPWHLWHAHALSDSSQARAGRQSAPSAGPHGPSLSAAVTTAYEDRHFLDTIAAFDLISYWLSRWMAERRYGDKMIEKLLFLCTALNMSKLTYM